MHVVEVTVFLTGCEEGGNRSSKSDLSESVAPLDQVEPRAAGDLRFQSSVDT